MSVKYNSDNNTTRSNMNKGSVYTLPLDYYNTTKPVSVPVIFRGLKVNTKYKVFLNNLTNDTYEDITEFCTPYGASRKVNTYRKPWLYFSTNSSGELYLEMQPFGTEAIDPDTKDWNSYWSNITEQAIGTETQRSDFFVVEYSKVISPDTIEKAKNLQIKPQSTTTLGIDSKSKDYRYIKQVFPSNLIQTFFIDPNAVLGSKTVDLEKVTLYFRDVPHISTNKSGVYNPSVIIAIIDIENGKPVITRQYKESIVEVPVSNITPSLDAENGVDFKFPDPLRLETGAKYGLAILAEDEDFELWYAKQGDVLVGTTTKASGSNRNFQGELYLLTTERPELITSYHDSFYSAKTDTNLKFDISACQYTPGNTTLEFVNRDYEFLTIDNSRAGFFGGEYVYANTTPKTGDIYIEEGTFTLVGNGTIFTDLKEYEPVLLQDAANSEIQEIVYPALISADDVVVLSEPVLSTIEGTYSTPVVAKMEHIDTSTNRMILMGSSANTTNYIDVNTELVGVASGRSANVVSVDDMGISSLIPDYIMDLSDDYRLRLYGNFTYDDNGTYKISNDTTFERSFKFDENFITKYNPLILSKSKEVRNTTHLFDSDNDGSGDKSAHMKLVLEYIGTNSVSYDAPEIDASHLYHMTQLWDINNDTTGEETGNGNARSRHISNPLTFQEGVYAEDLRVIYNAYVPPKTSFKVYAKIHHSNDDELLEDKVWTELTTLVGANQISNPEDTNDYKEFELGFPSVPVSASTLTGTVTTEDGSAVLTGKNTLFNSELTVGDVVKVYDPLFSDTNYDVYVVESITSDTEVVLSEEIRDFGIIGSTIKLDKLVNNQVAFLNPNNLGIVRYFDRKGQPHDGYDTVVIKTVLLSSDPNEIPYINDYRVIGVSA